MHVVLGACVGISRISVNFGFELNFLADICLGLGGFSVLVLILLVWWWILVFCFWVFGVLMVADFVVFGFGTRCLGLV